jgi:hypothetical protein
LVFSIAKIALLLLFFKNSSKNAICINVFYDFTEIYSAIILETLLAGAGLWQGCLKNFQIQRTLSGQDVL